MNNLTVAEKNFIAEMQTWDPLYQEWMTVEVEPNWFGLDTFSLGGSIDAPIFIPSGCTASNEILFGNFRIRGVHE